MAETPYNFGESLLGIETFQEKRGNLAIGFLTILENPY